MCGISPDHFLTISSRFPQGYGSQQQSLIFNSKKGLQATHRYSLFLNPIVLTNLSNSERNSCATSHWSLSCRIYIGILRDPKSLGTNFQCRAPATSDEGHAPLRSRKSVVAKLVSFERDSSEGCATGICDSVCVTNTETGVGINQSHPGSGFPYRTQDLWLCSAILTPQLSHPER